MQQVDASRLVEAQREEAAAAVESLSDSDVATSKAQVHPSATVSESHSVSIPVIICLLAHVQCL